MSILWLDRAIYDYLHRNYNHSTRPVPTILKMPTRLLRSLEDWGENVFITCVLLVLWKLAPYQRGRVICLVAAAGTTAFTVEALKRVVGRERPEVSQGINRFHYLSRFEEVHGDEHSFPSGHTAAAASYSASLTAYYPTLKPVMMFLAVGCGCSRVWKERHFFSDCLAAIVIGWWISTFFWKNHRLRQYWNWWSRKLEPRRPVMRSGFKTRKPNLSLSDIRRSRRLSINEKENPLLREHKSLS